jgi:hypothetical protein
MLVTDYELKSVAEKKQQVSENIECHNITEIWIIDKFLFDQL